MIGSINNTIDISWYNKQTVAPAGNNAATNAAANANGETGQDTFIKQQSMNETGETDVGRTVTAQTMVEGETGERSQNTRNIEPSGNSKDGENVAEKPGEETKNKTTEKTDEKSDGGNDGELSEEEKQEVQELKESDRKVRAHEMAHLSAAAGIAVSGANFQFERGPDGVNYAVGGDVQIDTSEGRTPEETIQKARKISAAAMAPADPSPQDRKVASQARSMEAKAQMELVKEKQPTSGNSQKAGETETNNPFSIGDTDSKGNIEKTFAGKPHPGIETYKKTQAFSIGETTNQKAIFDMVA